MNKTIEESTTDKISPLLHKLVKAVISDSKCCDSEQKDLFYILIIALMIETGFFPTTKGAEIIYDADMIDDKQLTEWKTSTGVLEVLFSLSGFENVPVKLIISPLGSTAMVNLVLVDEDSETYTACLPLSRYVVSPKASTIPMIFRDLKHLSVKLKNQVLAPVKSRILWLSGYPGASLVGLPEEVLYKIILYLPAIDVANLSSTCKRLKYLLDNEKLWHELYKKDFEDVATERSDWKVMYREKFLEKREAALVSRGRMAGAMHDYMDYSDYRSYLDPMWDNMYIS